MLVVLAVIYPYIFFPDISQSALKLLPETRRTKQNRKKENEKKAQLVLYGYHPTAHQGGQSASTSPGGQQQPKKNCFRVVSRFEKLVVI